MCKKKSEALFLVVASLFVWSGIGLASDESGEALIYPDKSLTPGEVLPVTKEEVCVPGYASKARNVSEATKREVFKRYNLRFEAGKYEVDHLISLELGGSNDVKNLWPEGWKPEPGAHEKDLVEGFLHRQVCKGAMTLEEAQAEIREDWVAVYEKIK